MPLHDDLGLRMKNFYEQIPKTRLMRRCPVALRIDGKAFHTFTRGFKKPFDDILIKTMQQTMKYLCENIQGCVLGYTQSDEITLILIDYQKLTSAAWFDYEVQKLCSISASMATLAFNRYFDENRRTVQGDNEYSLVLENAAKRGAMFDSRCFNIPKEEVTNLIYWRQLDASRNSIEMAGQANFSQKKLMNKSCSQIQDMLMLQKGINWNDFPVVKKRGSCCVKIIEMRELSGDEYMEYASDKVKPEDLAGKKVERSCWIIDENIPIFRGDDRSYIDKLIYVGE